jgi:hypothetical protein
MRSSQVFAKVSCVLFVIALTATALFPSGAQAAVIASHYGQLDPVNEGWQSVGSMSGAPINDGLNAWQMDDNSTGPDNFGIQYVFPTSSSVVSDAMTKGWVLDFNVKVLDAMNSTSMHIAFGGDGTSFNFDFRPSITNQGNQCFTLGSTSSLGGADSGYDTTGSGLSYQHYTIVYDPAVSAAKVYLNGGLVVSNWVAGAANGDPGIEVWTGSSRTGEMRLASLEFSAVPEPSVVSLFATGVFGLLAYAWRKRK